MVENKCPNNNKWVEIIIHQKSEYSVWITPYASNPHR
jgi:hypothetical protein